MAENQREKNIYLKEPGRSSAAESSVSNTVVEYVVALYPYRAIGANELSFDQGDRLEVLNKDVDSWWMARHPGTTYGGYIPAIYVAATSSLESHEWYHGAITRVEADQKLMCHYNALGSFLIRQSPRTKDYVLSVKLCASDGLTPTIKHYNITQTPDNYFALGGSRFLSLKDLVDHFSSTPDTSTNQNIPKRPCVRTPPAMQDISRENKEEWEMPRDELRFVKELGQGSFGEVWLGKWKNTINVAIKTVRDGRMETADFLEEAKVMKNLRHPNILALYAVCTKEEPLLIVTEFMSQGALLDLLRKEDMDLQLQLYIATQTAAAMEYLESKMLIHRDLAARNVLVGDCYVCKVADFGLSKLYEDAIYKGKESKGKLPIKWTAPEALLHQKFSSKSDVWSFGVMLTEILTNGAVPYPGFSNQELLEAITSGYRMPKPAGCPPPLYELILNCWKRNPDDRPAFEFIHDFLSNFGVQGENSYCESVF